MTVTCEEEIEVVCLFGVRGEAYGMFPLKARLLSSGSSSGGLVFNIKEVTGRWVSKEGVYHRYHYAVVDDAENHAEIFLDTRHMKWFIKLKGD
ncbi:MAG TPA: hypothetical protein VM163_06020 [bacterium]|nr:hypothetical protein [bacterium]